MHTQSRMGGALRSKFLEFPSIYAQSLTHNDQIQRGNTHWKGTYY